MILELADFVRLGVLIIAFLASVYYWKNYKNTPQRYFPLLLLFTSIVEVVAEARLYNGGHKSISLYNGYLILSFSFFLIWFIAILKRKIISKVLLSALLCVIAYAVFKESPTRDLYFSLIVTGSVLILIGAFLFFKELLEEEDVVNFLRNQQFWIMSGLLVFYIGFLPFYLLIRNLDLQDYRIGLVIPFLNILLYGCFIIGFRCTRK